MRAATKVAHSKCTSTDVAPPQRRFDRTTISQHSKHLKSWSEESVQLAAEALKKNKYTIREAVVAYNVSKSVLGDRVSGRVKMGATWAWLPDTTLRKGTC